MAVAALLVGQEGLVLSQAVLVGVLGAMAVLEVQEIHGVSEVAILLQMALLGVMGQGQGLA